MENGLGEIVAYYAEIHDIAVSKLVAGREKDFEFLEVALSADLILISEFLKRVDLVRSKVENDVLSGRLMRLIEFLNARRTHNNKIEQISEFMRESTDTE